MSETTKRLWSPAAAAASARPSASSWVPRSLRVCARESRQGRANAVVRRKSPANGGEARVVYFDVTDAAATRSALDTLLEQAPVQILVNNAGIHDDAAFPA